MVVGFEIELETSTSIRWNPSSATSGSVNLFQTRGFRMTDRPYTRLAKFSTNDMKVDREYPYICIDNTRNMFTFRNEE